MNRSPAAVSFDPFNGVDRFFRELQQDEFVNQLSDPSTLASMVVSLVQLKREHPVFQRRRWFKGRPLHGKDVADIAWLRPDGEPMSEAECERQVRLLRACWTVFEDIASTVSARLRKGPRGGGPRRSVLLFDQDLRYTLAEGEQLRRQGYSQEMLDTHFDFIMGRADPSLRYRGSTEPVDPLKALRSD